MTATFHVGDAIEVMGKLPEKSVDLILTSPPFLALRSYLPADHPDKALEGGSQATPGAFIDWLVDVVEACDRVLAPHGSLCIELGDTYAGSGGAGGDYDPGGWREGQEAFEGSGKRYIDSKYERIQYGDKGPPIANLHGKKQGGGTGWPLAKSLSLIPELFRFTLVYGINPLTGRTTERWRLRNVVRWVRPNPPVGALGDKFRPATSELMVFCKSAKRYFDLDAVREPAKDFGPRYATKNYNAGGQRSPQVSNPLGDNGIRIESNPAGAPPLDWWNIPLLEGEAPTKGGPKDRGYDPEERRQRAVQQTTNHGGSKEARQDFGEAFYNAGNPLGAPPLDWWNIPPGGYVGSHYAVFPPELCIKPIKAMSPERVCRQCGEPSRRIVEYDYIDDPNRPGPRGGVGGGRGIGSNQANQNGINDPANRQMIVLPRNLGFSDCGHDDWRPGVILDPFGGSGTTALVATGHGRDCILIDLDPRNFDLALDRVGPFILTLGSL